MTYPISAHLSTTTDGVGGRAIPAGVALSDDVVACALRRPLSDPLARAALPPRLPRSHPNLSNALLQLSAHGDAPAWKETIMDDARFDRWTRTVGAVHGRRAVVRLAPGGLVSVGAATVGDAAATPRRPRLWLFGPSRAEQAGRRRFSRGC